MSASLTLRITRGARDARHDLVQMTRADGSATHGKIWRADGMLPHDAMHIAVEGVLGYDQAFFGMIASGWNLEDWSAREREGKVTEQGLIAECIITVLGAIAQPGTDDSFASFRAALDLALIERGLTPPLRPNAADYARIQRELANLNEEWSRVPPGGVAQWQWQAPTIQQPARLD